MKKLLSIMLALCMLLTMFIIPVAAEEVDVNAGKLYYNFDFSEDTLYTDYANPVLPEGVTYEGFAAVSTAGTNVVEYGKIGDEDGLYIRTGGSAHNVVFTPLKKDGTPIVLEPGKSYVVEWEYVVTRGAGAWARPHIEPFTTLDGSSSNAGDRKTAYYETTTGEGEEAVTTKTYLAWDGGAKKTKLGFGSLYGGPEWQYWNAGVNFVSSAKDHVVLDAYEKKTETIEGAEGEEPTTKVSYVLREDGQYDTGTSATGVKYTTTQTVNVLTDAEMNETYGIVKNEDGSYTFGETAYNNFLGLSLPGGYGTYYYPGKDEKSIENVQDENGNWYHRAYSEYYVTGLRVYDAEYKFATVTCIDGAKETVVNTIPGEEINYPAVGTSYNGDKMWSLAADKYVPVPTVAGTEDIVVYAYVSPVVGFENYNTSDAYVNNVWLTNAMISNEKVYAGEKAIKYHNTNLNVIKTEPSDWATAWTKYYSYDAENDVFALLGGEAAPAFEVGKYYSARGSGSVEQGAFIVADFGPTTTDGVANVYNYTKRVSFKYFIPEGNTMDFAVSAIQFNKGNIWWGNTQVGAPVAISATPTGEWKTFEMLITAKDLEAVGNKGAGNQVVAVKVATATTTGANARNATIYIDDVTVEDFVVDNKVVYHYNDGVTADETITEGLEVGVAYKIDRIAAAPEGKYFAGWYTDEALTVPAGAEVMAPLSGTINLYAKYVDYATNFTYGYDTNITSGKYYQILEDGTLVSSFDKDGWSGKGWADGAGIYYSDRTWGQSGKGLALDADGNIVQFDATKKYLVSVKYKVTSLTEGGKVQLSAGIGVNPADYKDLNLYTFTSQANAIDLTEVNEDWQIAEFVVDGTKMAEGSIPAMGIYTNHSKAVDPENPEASGTVKNGIYNTITIDSFTVKAYDGTITYVDAGGNETVVDAFAGDAIDYPVLPANRNYDYVWSLAADKYVPVPKSFESSVTVYAYQNPVIGLENYSGHAYDKGANISVSDEKAFEGEKSFRYEDIDYTVVTAEQALKEVEVDGETTVAWLASTNQFFWKNMLVFDEETESFVKVEGDEAPEFEEGKYFRLRNNNKDHGLALWKLEKNKAYKVTYKYYVEKVSADINVTAVMSKNANIWTPSAINAGTAVISKDSVVGEWLDGEIYLNNASDNTELYMLFSNPGVATGDVLYFDDFAVEEVQVVSFVIPEGFTAEVYEGTFDKGVITTYLAMDAEVPVPVVVDPDGNPVETWIDADGKVVTEFVSGGVYTAYVKPAFIYGDCDDSGEVDTTDLAALKLNLANLGEVGLGADCNGDGSIDTTDLAVLKLYLANLGDLGPEA